MKVVFVTTLYPTDSEPAHGPFIRDQAYALTRSGCEVTVLHANLRSPRSFRRGAESPPEFEPRAEDAPSVLRWNGWTARVRSIPVLARYGAGKLASRYLQHEAPPDVVHGHFCFGGGTAAALVASKMNRPLVITEHSTEFARGQAVGWRRDVIRRAAEAADSLIAVSEGLAVLLEQVTRRQAIVIPNVVDVDLFRPRELARREGLFRIVSVGSLTKKKGYDILLRALALLPSGAWRVTLIGEGLERRRLTSMAHDLGIAGQVGMPGILEREAVAALLSEADAFVSSSRFETFGVAAAEALSVGVPVITTRSGGPESFVEAPFGLVVESDPASIAEAIGAVMGGGLRFDPRASHAKIGASFGPTAIAGMLQEVYASLADP